MIKGPHSAKEAEFEQMIIDDFKKVPPAVKLSSPPTTGPT